MKPGILFLIGMSVCWNAAVAQNNPIEIKTSFNDDKSLTISVEVRKYGTYSVLLTFTELENTSFGEKERIFVVRSNRPLLTLRPTNKDKYANCRYTYRYMTGDIEAKPDTTVIYRLPYSTDKSARVSDMYNIHQRHFGKDSIASWRPLQFTLNKGDTIFAARKGVVVDIKDGSDVKDNPEGIDFNSERNSISVEHSDGTVAVYSVLLKNSIMVKVGDTVYPDTPLALAGTYDSNLYQLVFDVTHIVDNRKNRKEADKNSWFAHVYVDPVFATTEGEKRLTARNHYTPVVTEQIVSREMTKREKQKVLKK